MLYIYTQQQQQYCNDSSDTTNTPPPLLIRLFLGGTGLFSQVKEEDGDVAGAAEVLQEVHVETYGALTKKEKADFILEQVLLHNRRHPT